MDAWRLGDPAGGLYAYGPDHRLAPVRGARGFVLSPCELLSDERRVSGRESLPSPEAVPGDASSGERLRATRRERATGAVIQEARSMLTMAL
jgi:hypothetical protein